MNNMSALSHDTRIVFHICEQIAASRSARLITSEHLLHALIYCHGAGGAVLRRLGLDYSELGLVVFAALLPPDEGHTLELSEEVKQVIKSAFVHARDTYRNKVWTGHLLLGLLDQDTIITQQLLTVLDLPREALSSLVISLMNSRLDADNVHPPTQTQPLDPGKHPAVQRIRKLLGRQREAIPQVHSHFVDYAALLQAVSLLIEQHPHKARLYVFRASIYTAMKDWQHAEADAHEAVRLNAELASAYHYRAAIHEGKRDFAAAMADLDEYLKRRPEALHVRVMHGSLYHRMGNAASAIAEFTSVLERQPHHVTALVRLANVYMTNMDWDTAFRHVTHALSYEPQNADALDTRGTLYAHLGNLVGAEQDFRAVLKLCPQWSRAYSNMAWLKLLHKRYDEALRWCNEAIRLNSSNGQAYYTRGACYAAKGDKRGAIRNYKLSLQHWHSVDLYKLTRPYAETMRKAIE
jgi:tetratricopeptide (TPR) repeat protein